MDRNPVLRKLGFAPDDRVVILHADDVGMCQATLPAFAGLADFGLVSSGAVMVPAPWFLEAAAYCRQHPQVDMGVHLTLTSEWETYRWGPISTRDAASGLLDEQGYLSRTVPPLQEKGNPDAVQAEITAQLERALAEGIEPTHIDTHMGAVASIKFIPGYVQLAIASGLPPMLLRYDEAGWCAQGLDAATAAFAARTVHELEEQGLPMLDNISMLPLDQPENRIDVAKRALAALPAGLTHFIIHPAADTPELRAITPDAPSRVADYATFTSAALRTYIRETGIQIIGYRALRTLMRQANQEG
jgi:chitin disaccharide deacetylase